MSHPKRCGACDRTNVRVWRRGVVVVAHPTKGPARARVCSRCGRKGVLVVPYSAPEAPSEQELEIQAVLRGLSKHLEGMATAYRSEGLSRAADIANAWADQQAARRES